MALGIPVIATDCPCGGPAALIEQGVNGLLVPVGDAFALADVIFIFIKSARCHYQVLSVRTDFSLRKLRIEWIR